MCTRQEWEDLFRIAVTETDFTKMEERVQAVESALRQRLHELSLDHGGTPEEKHAIMSAERSLKVLRTEAARWCEEQQAGNADGKRA